jgi:hypothetical protein
MMSGERGRLEVGGFGCLDACPTASRNVRHNMHDTALMFPSMQGIAVNWQITLGVLDRSPWSLSGVMPCLRGLWIMASHSNAASPTALSLSLSLSRVPLLCRLDWIGRKRNRSSSDLQALEFSNLHFVRLSAQLIYYNHVIFDLLQIMFHRSSY